MEEPECCNGCKWYQEFTEDDDRYSVMGCNHPCIAEEMCLNENRPNIKGIHYES